MLYRGKSIVFAHGLPTLYTILNIGKLSAQAKLRFPPLYFARFALSIQNIGGTSDVQKMKTVFPLLYFARFALSLPFENQ